MYRDSFPACPICSVELADTVSYRGCPSCRGVFVTEEVLTSMVQEMHRGGAETEPLLWETGFGPTRSCPDCKKPMRSHVLENITVERCPDHGVWLDNRELPQVLLNAAARPPRSVGIAVDLRPIERRGRHSEAYHEADRNARLSRWIVENVPVVTARARAIEDAQLAKAIEPVLAQLASRPLAERPSYEAVIALDARIVDGTADTTPRSDITAYLRTARYFLRGWCVAYGVLVEHVSQGALSPTHVRDYLDDVDTAQRDAWAAIAIPGERLRTAHTQLVQLVDRHVRHLKAAFAAVARSESDARAELAQFVATFDEIEEATMDVVAACTA